jgi:hypothetical protein
MVNGKPILLIARNDEDWKLNADTGKFTHPFGPNPKTPAKKTVTVTYNFTYAGVAADLAEPKEGPRVGGVDLGDPVARVEGLQEGRQVPGFERLGAERAGHRCDSGS